MTFIIHIPGAVVALQHARRKLSFTTFFFAAQGVTRLLIMTVSQLYIKTLAPLIALHGWFSKEMQVDIVRRSEEKESVNFEVTFTSWPELREETGCETDAKLGQKGFSLH